MNQKRMKKIKENQKIKIKNQEIKKTKRKFRR